ncbi:hypothetical protein ABPG77_001194 [Micractinium sp. CCAP 211/92]
MPGVPGPGAGQPQQPLGHRSWDRREGTGLALENGSQRLGRRQPPTQQLAVQDQPVFYAPRLPPGTPSSRRWRAVIHEPRQQQWSPALHSLAGPRFRGAARTLLLCHRRLAAMRAEPLKQLVSLPELEAEEEEGQGAQEHLEVLALQQQQPLHPPG